MLRDVLRTTAGKQTCQSFGYRSKLLNFPNVISYVPGLCGGQVILKNCEVIRLDCDLLLMDTVNVSSRVRTIAYRMYRTPVQYSIHYLCNVNNTPSSDS